MDFEMYMTVGDRAQAKRNINRSKTFSGDECPYSCTVQHGSPS